MMKKWFYILIAALAFHSCSDDEPEKSIEPDNASGMTVLAYLVANNNLNGYLRTNISAMYDGLSDMTQSATLLVYWDGQSSIKVGENNSYSNPVILKYETDGEGNINGQPTLDATATVEDVLALAEVVKEYPSQLSTSQTVMAQVLKDMVGMTKTEKVGLVAGSHGSAWVNSIFPYSGRSFGQDGSGTDNTLLISEMAEAMKTAGKTFDFLLFDACMMGSAEVCYELKDVVNYQIVSVVDIPAAGFPYEDMMSCLYAGDVAGYKQACQVYLDNYRYLAQSSSNAWGTVSLIDSKELDALASLVKEQVVGHKDVLADYDVSGLQQYGLNPSASGFKYISVDMKQLVAELNGGAVPATFQTQLDKVVLYADCLENTTYFNVDKANYCGMGMYVPVSTRSGWNDYFKTIDWYTAAGWNEVTFSWE